MRNRKNLNFLFCILLAICLAGCVPTRTEQKTEGEAKLKAGGNISVSEQTEEITAKDIVIAYVEAGYNNYRQTIIYQSSVDMASSDDSLVFPSTVTIESERAGDYIYEVQKVSVDHDELVIEYADETYIVKNGSQYELYTSLMNQDNWFLTETKDAKKARVLTLDPCDFENAVCSLNKENDTYIVELSLSELNENNDLFLNSLISGLDESSEAVSGLKDTVKKSSANAVYTFDAETMKLLYIEYDPLEYSYSLADSSSKNTITCTGSMTITFSDYGKVKEKKVTVPSKIQKKSEKSEEETI